jgi:hypothetical protein
MNTATVEVTELRQELNGIINALPYHKLAALKPMLELYSDITQAPYCDDDDDTLTPEEAAEIDRRSAEYDADPSCSIPFEIIQAERKLGRNLMPEEAAQIELEVRPERGSSLEDLIEKYRKLAEWRRVQDELEAQGQGT